MTLAHRESERPYLAADEVEVGAEMLVVFTERPFFCAGGGRDALNRDALVAHFLDGDAALGCGAVGGKREA